MGVSSRPWTGFKMSEVGGRAKIKGGEGKKRRKNKTR